MGRKRNQGKARKAAKAKAREEADERGNNNNNNQTTNNGPGQSSLMMRQLQLQADGANTTCRHGFDPLSVSTDIFVRSFQFVPAFQKSFDEAAKRGGLSFSNNLVDAKNATWDEYADVWTDLAKMEMALSVCFCSGTDAILGNNCQAAVMYAADARYFEQHIAVEVKQTQALYNWPKVCDTYEADLHTLVKFFRHRIPCSCLDEKYQEVKHITKKGCCYNAKCSTPVNRVERSKTKYCSRCRSATYCSRECQVADWTTHAPFCDNGATLIAKFQARQQNM